MRFWSDVVIERPSAVVIDLLQMRQDGTVTIQGACESEEPVIAFQNNLLAREDILEDVQMPFYEGPVDDEHKRFRGGKIFKFEMTMKHIEKETRLKSTPTPKFTPRLTP